MCYLRLCSQINVVPGAAPPCAASHLASPQDSAVPMRDSPVVHPSFLHRSHIPMAVSSKNTQSRTSSSADHPDDCINNNTRRILTSATAAGPVPPSRLSIRIRCRKTPDLARLASFETGVAPLPEAAEAPEREPPPAAPDAVAVGHDVCAEVAAADVL